MKLNIVYKNEKEWFIGHIQEYPDYESQGKTLDELKENLIEIYHDINNGLVPDDWYKNPQSGKSQPIPRHTEIEDSLAKRII